MSHPVIAVIGAGAWGTALACSCARAAEVVLWMRSPVTQGMRTLPRLPGVMLPERVTLTNDLPGRAELALLAIPTQSLRDISTRLDAVLEPGVPVVVCCKGLEAGTSLLPLDILAQTMPGRPAMVLSGPNFAIEVALGLPSAATLACHDMRLAQHAVSLLARPSFRLYASSDPIGVQLAGAAKNVVAIGTGVTIGAGMGENARAALITRAVAEIGRLTEAAGGQASTVSGLAGMGDLILTCTGPGSRNYSLGLALGRGETLTEILAERTTVAEGVMTAPALLALGRSKKVETPIIEAVSRLLAEELTPSEARDRLLDRPATSE